MPILCYHSLFHDEALGPHPGLSIPPACRSTFATVFSQCAFIILLWPICWIWQWLFAAASLSHCLCSHQTSSTIFRINFSKFMCFLHCLTENFDTGKCSIWSGFRPWIKEDRQRTREWKNGEFGTGNIF